jgi:hypothetical protein
LRYKNWLISTVHVIDSPDTSVGLLIPPFLSLLMLKFVPINLKKVRILLHMDKHPLIDTSIPPQILYVVQILIRYLDNIDIPDNLG